MDDDDIQEYQRPWVNLTEKQVDDLANSIDWIKDFIRKIEKLIKENNA